MRRLIVIIFALTLSVSVSAQWHFGDKDLSGTLLVDSELNGLSIEELALMRNWIYACHGYVFKDPARQSFFEKHGWYTPIRQGNAVQLSSIEKRNVDMLKRREAILQAKRDATVSDLKKLKQALNDNNKKVVDQFVGDLHRYEDFDFDSLTGDLSQALNHVDIEHLYWNHGRGYYRNVVDNGYCVFVFILNIENGEITISYAMESHSENFGDFDDGYSDYQSENEYSLIFTFTERENGSIEFSILDVVG